MKGRPAGTAGRELALEAFGQPLDYPYLMGVYLAANAVSDLAVLVDGPDCARGKAEHIFGKHDLRSTLLDCRGLHRVECTFTDARNAALSREKEVRDRLLCLARRDDVAAVLACALPLAQVTGTDYARVLRSCREEAGKPVCIVPAKSLQGGFMEGYSAALAALARGIALPEVRRVSGTVALVGLFMDRNEEDRRADLAEAERILRGLGLRLVSAWPAGGSCSGLARAASAQAVVALPYGREAAKILARRTGARFVETGLPLGLEASRRWTLALGRALGREEIARRFIDRELGRVAPRLEWVVGHSFLNKRFWLAGEGTALRGLAGFIEELGGLVAGGASVGGSGQGGDPGEPFLRRPTEGLWRRSLEEGLSKGLDLVVGPTPVVRAVRGRCAAMELGFPSYHTHAAAPQPCLGFEGCLGLAGRMLNAMGRRAARRIG